MSYQTSANHTQSLISSGMKIIGDVKLNETFIHKGQIIGNLISSEKVILENNASIEGNVSVDQLFLELGSITGSVECASNCELLIDSLIKGDVKAESLSLSGKIEGNITVSNSIYLSEHAEVIGNIDAKDIQVEAGAKITGQLVIKG